MWRLALRTLRFRKGGFAAAFIAMFAGAVLVMACGGLMETGIRVDVPAQRLAGADIVVAGDQRYELPKADPGDREEDTESAILAERVRVDAALVDELAAVPGVERATGHDLTAGTAPSGTVDAIKVEAAPGADVEELRGRVDTVLEGSAATTLVGDDRGLAELPEARAGAENLVTLAGVFGGWAIMAAMFGVASTLALSVQQRQREMALLRAVGTTPGQLRRMVLGETLILAVLATGLAYLPGPLVGEWLFERMTGAGVVPAGVEFHQGWIPAVVAVGASLLAAVGGALVAGRRAAAVRPTQALAEVSLEGRLISPARVVFALLFLAGGIALGVVTVTVMSGPLTSSTAGPAVILWAVGLALLSPVLTRAMTSALRWPIRAFGLSGHLAVLNAGARSARMAAVVSPVILLTGIATGTLYLQATEDATNRQEFADGFIADVVVSSPEGVDDGLVREVSRVDGVAGASAHVTSTAFVERPFDATQNEEGWAIQGVSVSGAAATTPVTVRTGSLTELTGDAVALPAGHAQALGVTVGDEIRLRLGDGASLDAEVVALFDAADDYATLLVPADTLAAHTTSGRATELLVAADAGADRAAFAAGVAEVAAAYPRASVTDRDALFAAHADHQQTLAFANYTVVAMIVGYAAVSVINTLVSSTAARRREFGLQRLVGSTRRQVLRMIGAEGVLVAVTGVVLGTVASVATLVPFSLARAESLTPSGSPWIYVGVVATALTLTLGATLLPGWRAMRSRPAEAAVAVD